MIILQHYTLIVKQGEEWSDVDKNYTMTQIIPEMSHYFSVVDSTNMASATKKIKALRLQKLRNMLLNNAAYKQAAIDVFMSTKIYSEKLIKRIWDELKK